jgi:capsular exopolysaccharide synthesis family protein
VDIADYLRILRARWLLVACFVVVAVGAAWLTTSVVPIAVSPATVYRASAVMLKTGDTGGLSLTTLATVTTIEPVAEQVAEAIGYRRNPLSLTDQIQAVGDDQGGLLTITATDTDPGRTELLANQFAKQLVAYLTKRSAESSASQAEAVKLQMDDMNRQISNLEGKILIAPKPEAEVLTAQRNALITTYGNLSAQYQSLLAAGTLPIGLETLQEANATPAPLVGLQPPRSRVMRSLLAALIGLLLGAGAAIGLEQIRGRIITTPAPQRASAAPVVGEIPIIGRRYRKSLVSVKKPHSVPARAFRILAAVLSGSNDGPSSNAVVGGSGSPIILVTSAGPDEGKTTVVGNLAVAFADAGHRVLILSTDFHRPRIHALFHVRQQPGLSDQLLSPNGKPVLEGTVVKTPVPYVQLVPSGSFPTWPGLLLGSSAMRSALEEARVLADVVLVDTPPLLSEGDAAQLIPSVDSVVVVARSGRLKTDTARRAGEMLQRLRAPMGGVILNRSDASSIAPGRYERSRSHVGHEANGNSTSSKKVEAKSGWDPR